MQQIVADIGEGCNGANRGAIAMLHATLGRLLAIDSRFARGLPFCDRSRISVPSLQRAPTEAIGRLTPRGTMERRREEYRLNDDRRTGEHPARYDGEREVTALGRSVDLIVYE